MCLEGRLQCERLGRNGTGRNRVNIRDGKKRSICLNRYVIRVFGFYENKGEVNCGLESYPENLGLKGLGIIFSY